MTVNEANPTSPLQGHLDAQKEGHMPTEGPCEEKSRNPLCSLLEPAVAASQTCSFVGIVPVLHIYFSDDDSLPETLLSFI